MAQVTIPAADYDALRKDHQRAVERGLARPMRGASSEAAPKPSLAKVMQSGRLFGGNEAA
jgi:hypothetical protein